MRIVVGEIDGFGDFDVGLEGALVGIETHAGDELSAGDFEGFGGA